MGRLTRTEAQERNRARVLAAARAEFAERGFREAKVDSIAERAELTRGAVYSNFPGKRALYFAVLVEAAGGSPDPLPDPGLTPAEAMGALARAWLSRLPLATDARPEARLGVDLLPEIQADERTRLPFAELMKLSAVLLGLALERLRPTAGRRVRVAEAALTTLHGATLMAAAAPGFVEPFDIVRACERLADLDLGDRWPPRPMVPPTRPADDPWSPPPATDLVTAAPARLDGDGVVAVLGLHRASAVEEAVRAAPPGAAITAVLVTSDPAELSPLARLVLADLRSCLRRAFPVLPALQVVCDDTGAVAAAAGVTAVSDATETAVQLRSGRVIARAEGIGASHAAASARIG